MVADREYGRGGRGQRGSSYRERDSYDAEPAGRKSRLRSVVQTSDGLTTAARDAGSRGGQYSSWRERADAENGGPRGGRRGQQQEQQQGTKPWEAPRGGKHWGHDDRGEEPDPNQAHGVWTRLGGGAGGGSSRDRWGGDAAADADHDSYQEQAYREPRRVQRRGEQRQPVWDRLSGQPGRSGGGGDGSSYGASGEGGFGGGGSRGGGGPVRRSTWNEHDDRYEEVEQQEEEPQGKGGRHSRDPYGELYAGAPRRRQADNHDSGRWRPYSVGARGGGRRGRGGAGGRQWLVVPPGRKWGHDLFDEVAQQQQEEEAGEGQQEAAGAAEEGEEAVEEMQE